ncbi:MAG: hypothetical protein KAT29_05360 [Anaerolineales bacterium]|jgi:hypothetical protein|nr:hypothetical protein [Anaerolineales bacterium]
MGKYDKYNPQSHMAETPWKIHPVWRGIGCLMILIIPALAFAGAILVVQANADQKWVPIPAELSQSLTLPLFGTVESILAVVIVAVLLALIGFGVMTIIYSLVYSLIGPPRYGPQDAPPIYNKPNNRRRR